MVPTILYSTLAVAVALGLGLGLAGLLRRNTFLVVGAALLVLTAAGFAFSAIALS